MISDARRRATNRFRQDRDKIEILFTMDDSAKIRAAAAASGESLAGFCRRVLLDYIQDQAEAGRSADGAARPEEERAKN